MTLSQLSLKFFSHTFVRIISIGRLLRSEEFFHMPIHIRQDFRVNKLLTTVGSLKEKCFHYVSNVYDFLGIQKYIQATQ